MCCAGHALKETPTGHCFWWESARTVLYARKAAAKTCQPDALKTKPLPPVELAQLGSRDWQFDRDNLAVQRGGGGLCGSDMTNAALVNICICCICTGWVLFLSDVCNMPQGKRKMGRPPGAKDKKKRRIKGQEMVVEDDQSILSNLLQVTASVAESGDDSEACDD